MSEKGNIERYITLELSQFEAHMIRIGLDALSAANNHTLEEIYFPHVNDAGDVKLLKANTSSHISAYNKVIRSIKHRITQASRKALEIQREDDAIIARLK